MKQALYNKDGVLISHGYLNFKPGPGETVRDVPDDYNIKPGTVRLVGGKEQPYAPPPPEIDNSKTDDFAKIDAAVADQNLPPRMRDALAAIRRRIGPLLALLLLLPTLGQAATIPITGFVVATDCGLVPNPQANQTACLQSTTISGRVAGNVYVYTGTWDLISSVGSGAAQPLDADLTTLAGVSAETLINLSGRGGIDAGSSDAYAANLARADAAYITNAYYALRANTVNDGAASVDYNSLGVKSIKKWVSGSKADPAAGDICAGQTVIFLYDGTDMVLQSPPCNPPSGGGGTPGGATTQVQVNVAGAFAGDAEFTYDPTADRLTVGNLDLGTCSGCWELTEASLLLLRTKSITFMIGSDTGSALADTDDQLTIWRNNIAAMTITEIWAESDAGTPIINLQRDDGSAANICSSNLTATTSGATCTLAAAEDNLALGDKIDFTMVTAGGTAKRVTIGIKATLD